MLKAMGRGVEEEGIWGGGIGREGIENKGKFWFAQDSDSTTGATLFRSMTTYDSELRRRASEGIRPAAPLRANPSGPFGADSATLSPRCI